MNRFKLLLSYFQWFMSSKNLHNIHSPFVFDLIRNCIKPSDEKTDYTWLENERKALIRKTETIAYEDMGAGKKTMAGFDSKAYKKATIGQLARRSLQKPVFCKIFHRMAKHFHYENILELGTSFGVTTSYLASSHKSANVHTIEGDPNIAAIARETFKSLNLKNINLHTGHFDKVLPMVLTSENLLWDMAYIDGNHCGEALLNYFNSIVKQLNPKGVVILDDIRWSDSMWQTWLTIKSLDSVTLTIDLFKCGLVFVNPDLTKENYKIRVSLL